MVTVSHCCPITSRACCSLALRRLIPLNWKQQSFIRKTKDTINHNLTFSWGGVTSVPPGVGLHTPNGLGVRCCRLSLWTQILLHSPHSQWRSPAVQLLSVPSHCVVPPSMVFRGKRGTLCATVMCWHLWETMKTVGRMQHAIQKKLSSTSKEKLLPAIWCFSSV